MHNRPREQNFDVWQPSAEVKTGSARFFNVSEIAQNRPREQDFDAWQPSAEVKAGSARFFTLPVSVPG